MGRLTATALPALPRAGRPRKYWLYRLYRRNCAVDRVNIGSTALPPIGGAAAVELPPARRFTPWQYRPGHRAALEINT